MTAGLEKWIILENFAQTEQAPFFGARFGSVLFKTSRRLLCCSLGGWVDGRTLWPPSGSVRHPCKSLETTSWDWKLRLLLQGTKKRTKNKRMPKSHEARGYKSKLTAAQHLLLFGRFHDA